MISALCANPNLPPETQARTAELAREHHQQVYVRTDRMFAVLMAVRRRRPRGAVIHSDQGTQFGSDAWRRFCRSHHLEPSMSRKGNCWDNAVAESFFGSLKKERIKKHIYKNRELALNDVADYIDRFYNRTRRHSHLGGVSPEQFEAAQKPR